MTREEMIADLKKTAQEYYLQGKDTQYQELTKKIRKLEGAINDNLICESCQ